MLKTSVASAMRSVELGKLVKNEQLIWVHFGEFSFETILFLSNWMVFLTSFEVEADWFSSSPELFFFFEWNCCRCRCCSFFFIMFIELLIPPFNYPKFAWFAARGIFVEFPIKRWDDPSKYNQKLPHARSFTFRNYTFFVNLLFSVHFQYKRLFKTAKTLKHRF